MRVLLFLILLVLVLVEVLWGIGDTLSGINMWGWLEDFDVAKFIGYCLLFSVAYLIFVRGFAGGDR